jgi:hypothetical protein
MLVYFVLFGKLQLLVPSSPMAEDQDLSNHIPIGKANIGWTIGEEVLYDKNL